MTENGIIHFHKNKAVRLNFNSCELSKEAIDFLEGKWILDRMDAYCNAVHFLTETKTVNRFSTRHMECLRTLMNCFVLCNTDINQLLSLYVCEHPFT